MQRKYNFHRIIFFVVLVFATSCGFEIPEKLTVKANPTVNLSAGVFKKDVSEFFSTDNLKELLGDQAEVSNLQFWKYEPTDEPTDETETANKYDGNLAYLVRYPITEVEMDISKYSDSLNIADNISESLETQTFEIPEINKTIEESQGLNFCRNLISSVNSGVKKLEIPLLQPGNNSIEATLGQNKTIAFEMKDENDKVLVNSVTFGDNSSLSFNFSQPSDVSNNYVVEIKSLVLKEDDGTTIASSSTPATITQNGGSSIVLDVSNKTLPTVFYMEMSVSSSGGTAYTNTKTETSILLSETSTITKASGFNLIDDDAISITIPETTVEMGIENFVSAKIDTGSVKLNIGIENATLTNFTKTITLSIFQDGGIEEIIEEHALTADEETNGLIIDLTNKTINNNNIKVTGSIVVTAEDGSFEINSGNDINIKPKVETNVEKFTEVVVSLPETFELAYTIEEDIPTEMADWIKEIKFSKVGLNITLENGLPTGNDIEATISSKAFQLQEGVSKIFLAPGVGEDSPKETTQELIKENFIFNPRDVSKMDISFKIGLTGYDPDTDTLTLTNVEPGTTLSLGGRATFLFDWAEITVEPKDAQGVSGTFPEEGTLDLSALKDVIGEDIGIGDISANFYFSSPVLKSFETTISGTVTAKYTENEKSLTNYLFGSAEGASIVELKSLPTNTSQIDDVWTSELKEASAPMNKFSDVINAKPSDLSLEYNFTFNSITVQNNEAFKALETAKLSAELYMILPIKLKVLNDAGAIIDLTEYITGENEDGSTSDIFGRTEPTDLSEIDEYLENYSFSLSLNYKNNLGLACKAIISDTSGFKKTLPLELGDNTMAVNLTKAEAKHILESLFSPTITLEISYPSDPEAEGCYWIKSDASIEVEVKLAATANVNYALEF